MATLTRILLARPRLPQVTLAVLLGAVIFGGVYLADQGSTGQGTTQINAPAVADARPPRVGQPAADFQLTSPDDQPISLSQFRNRPVWINFWAS